MDWEGREESSNVEDQRSGGGRKVAIAGGGLGLVIIVVLGLVFGVDIRPFLGMGGGGPGPGPVDPGRPGINRPVDPEEEQKKKFVSVILHDTEVIWTEQFQKQGKTYQKPTLVIFSDEAQSACGFADAAVGPFYCPGDHKVYIDLTFFGDMERKLKAPGEFARAYVIAHEVGHHVQRLLGYSARADEAKRRRAPDANEMSVRLELQADYLAGVWAHHGQKKYNFLHKGDVETALNAAFQIGDDTLQKRGRGRVQPDTFTHGTSKQRVRWFQRGLETGSLENAKQLFELKYNDL